MNKSLIITPLLLVGTLILFEVMPIDLWLQNHFYNFSQQQWLVDKQNGVLRFIFYDGIKAIYILFVLLLLIALLWFKKHPTVHFYKQGLLLVLLSTICVPLVISMLKATTNMPCPKDTLPYGGNYPIIGLFHIYPASYPSLPKIKCFPAGHASGGFALLSLFFLFRTRRNKVIALISTLTLAWAIGGYKMLIGDHFLSHTLVSMLLSWWIILIIRQQLMRRQI